MVAIEQELRLEFRQRIEQARQCGYTVIAGRPLTLSGPTGFKIASFLVLGIIAFLSFMIFYTFLIK
ncbi:MAG: hypothetical protein ABSF82_07835 [Candidatus Bathyarchaeia archaeon]